MDSSDKKLKKVEKNQNNGNIQSEHKSLEEISKEKKTIENMENYSLSLNNYFSKIKSLTKIYCSKLIKIIEKIDIENITKSLDKNPERKIELSLCQIIKGVVELLTKDFINIKTEQKKNFAFVELDEKLKELEEIFLLDLNKLEFTKKAYHQEFKQFELSLIKDEINKKKSSDNIKIALDLQQAYFDINKKIKAKTKKIFEMFHKKRKLLFNQINEDYKLFIKNLYNVIEKIQKKIEEEKTNIYNTKNALYLKNIEVILNKVFVEDIYEFKFLSLYKNENKQEKEMTQEPKDEYEILFDQLSEKNIENLAGKIKIYGIPLGQKNLDKLNLIKSKKNIESTILLILNSPEKFCKNEIENFLQALSSSKQDLNVFLEYLNNHRAKGGLNLKKKSINILCEIFLYIFEISIKNKDIKIIQICVILSQTYYHEEEDKKIYMIYYLKKSKIFGDKKFWLNYLRELIDEEIKKFSSKTQTITEKQMSTAVYSSIFTMTKNMVDFELDMGFITEVNNEVFDMYNTPDNQKRDIINYLIIELQSPK